MAVQGRLLLSVAALALAFGLCPAHAQTRADCEVEYTPQRAQDGKDVIWVPTEDSMVGRMLEMANVGAADTVYDLGAGDGKIVIAAAKLFGASGVGIEYDADLVRHARCLARAEGVHDRVAFVQGDIFEADFSDATVVAMYLTPQVNERLLPTLLAMKPGTRVVSYSFAIGDWPPDAQLDSFGDGSAFFWVVPANVAGQWSFEPVGGGPGYDLTLEQEYQELRGSYRGAPVAGKLRGNEIELTFLDNGGEIRLTGTVQGASIAVTAVLGSAVAEYRGTRR